LRNRAINALSAAVGFIHRGVMFISIIVIKQARYAVSYMVIAIGFWGMLRMMLPD
jgi:hypothetical protein